MLEEIIKEIEELNSLDGKDIGERFIKYGEEFGEFSAEVAKAIGITQKEYDAEHLIEESADALQCLLSIMIAICNQKGLNFFDIIHMIVVKNQKWRSKMPLYTRNEF